MCSYGLLPKIMQPARTTETTATIIDNIFTNNFSANTISGNILTDFSDHFGQFVSIKRLKIDYKTINMFKRDYSNFNKENFIDDVKVQRFSNNFTDVNAKFIPN